MARASSRLASSTRAVDSSESPDAVAGEEPQPDRDRDQLLLSTVMEVAFEPLPLVRRRGHDALAGGRQVGELGARLRPKPLMLEPEAGSTNDFVDRVGLLEDLGPMLEQGDDLAVADDRRDLPASGWIRREVEVQARGIDSPPAGQRVRDAEIRVAERRRQGVAKPTDRRGVAEIRDHPGDARPRSPRPEPLNDDAARHEQEERGLGEPKGMGRAVSRQNAPPCRATKLECHRQSEERAGDVERCSQGPGGRRLADNR